MGFESTRCKYDSKLRPDGTLTNPDLYKSLKFQSGKNSSLVLCVEII